MTRIEGVLRRYQVLKQGHFQLASGLHSPFYFEKFRILEHPPLVELFAKRIAAHFRRARPTVVCGPTTGGVIIAFEVARQLGTRCIFAERAETGRTIGRGFALNADDRVLVVDDVLTTGGSVRETLQALAAHPGAVVGIGIFIDRSTAVDFGPPLFAVYRAPVVTYPPDACPLCRQGLPLATPGGKGKS